MNHNLRYLFVYCIFVPAGNSLNAQPSPMRNRKLQLALSFYMNTFLPNYLLRKVLVSTLLVVLYSQVFAQNKFAHERRAAVPDHGYSNASLQSASVLKMNIFAPLLGYSQFSWEKYTGYHSSLELGLGIIGAGKNLHRTPVDPFP
ncbi:MAG: hypothetical protein ABI358_12925 [Ginsengibacter sp.]